MTYYIWYIKVVRKSWFPITTVSNVLYPLLKIVSKNLCTLKIFNPPPHCISNEQSQAIQSHLHARTFRQPKISVAFLQIISGMSEGIVVWRRPHVTAGCSCAEVSHDVPCTNSIIQGPEGHAIQDDRVETIMQLSIYQSWQAHIEMIVDKVSKYLFSMCLCFG